MVIHSYYITTTPYYSSVLLNISDFIHLGEPRGGDGLLLVDLRKRGGAGSLGLQG